MTSTDEWVDPDWSMTAPGARDWYRQAQHQQDEWVASWEGWNHVAPRDDGYTPGDGWQWGEYHRALHVIAGEVD